MNYTKIQLPKNYVPSENELFMCKNQKAYFYQKLMTMQNELENQAQDILSDLKISAQDLQGASDDGDKANEAMQQQMGMRQVERNRRLIKQVQKALFRLDSNSYGLCVATGDSISLKRLEARPVATRTADAQANHEDNDSLTAK